MKQHDDPRNSLPMNDLLVLLVDDNEALNFLHAKLCSLNLPNAEVMSFAEGGSALDFLMKGEEIIRGREVLILLDIRMPGVDGWEMLAVMEEYGLGEKYNVVMLTSSTSPADRSRAMKYPFVMGYLEKPLRGFQLIELAKELDKIPNKEQ